MQFAVSQIMIMVLLIHSALGCCLHHSHTCNVNCGDSSTAIATACPCESHQLEEHALLEEQHNECTHSAGEHHRHEHDCDGDHCTFVRSDQSREQCGKCSFDVPFFSWDASLQEGNRMGVRFSRVPGSLTSNSSPSVRSHLLLSILLI